jgi:drug/metabolite transporter (DMT)-like permease
MSDHGWFAAWVIVGCGLALGAVSFALGPLVFVPAAVAAVLMFRRPAARRTAFAVLIGIGVLLLFIAYVNRDGPGDHLNPLPWLVLGVAFVGGGFAADRLRRR